ncbi:hypothetical protein CCZ01_01335 [Helicobacter monodelphidis]|uniref:hypothetical protein n=1 Tax=Helicobacter sp. 15-1451 TaxID=2004995 RepID=UPI000DCBFFD6|nr:hypothetical protein [Helicobacter sp. 15-1451]RAX58867.1 hypothetical protein CCZ01_01335 [Helicobacter sp. 15-1451]
MPLYVPSLRPDLQECYTELSRQIEKSLAISQTSSRLFVEIYVEDEKSNVESHLQLPKKMLYQAVCLAEVVAQTFKPTEPIGFLCLNQILHRTPNPYDLVRSLIPLLDIDGSCGIIEFSPTQQSPYPHKTPAVFSYGTRIEQAEEYLESCYYQSIQIFINPPLYLLVSKAVH